MKRKSSRKQKERSSSREEYRKLSSMIMIAHLRKLMLVVALIVLPV